jgi:hypothetical protein
MGTPHFTVLTDGLDEVTWREQRRPGVTATDVARLHSGGAGTWAAIRAEKQGTEPDFTFPAMQHGKDREPVIARFAERRFGLRPSRAVLAAVDDPRWRATPDGIGDAAVGEYKTTVVDWPTLDDLPVPYYDQATWQMRVTGLREAHLVFEAHEGGIPLHMEPRSFLIRYDDVYARELEEVAERFLAADTAPDPRAAELDALISLHLEAKALEKAAADRVEAIGQQVRDLVGGDEGKFIFEGSYGNLTLGKTSTRAGFDRAGLEAEAPELAKKYATTISVRGRLTISARKADR